MSRYLPVMFDTAGMKVLLVGGGEVAERKVEKLLATEADVTVVSPSFTAELEALSGRDSLKLVNRKFKPEDVRGVELVFVACGEVEAKQEVLKECKKNKIPVNVVDEPKSCDFILPASLRRKDLVVAISTSGKSPALAKKLRRHLEEELGEEYGDFLQALGDIRPEVLARIDSFERRKSFFESVVYSDILENYLDGRIDDMKQEIRKRLESFLKE